ncbi:MAG: hypothetical protein ACTHN5_06270 [Phycisphaerae bacterium]
MADDETPPPSNPNEGPGKGKAFFDRAKTVAATNNFDYAIDMYIEGLNREPFNVDEHKALRDVGFRRKVAGGKPPGGLLGPKPPYKGKTAKEAMLNAAWTLAKDVGNIPAMQQYLRNAVTGEYRDVALWIGPILREANRTSKSPKLEIYLEMVETYKKMEEYKLALEAQQAAIQMKPNDMNMAAEAQAIAALEVLQKGKYDKGATFKESIKDKESTKKLLEEENLNRSEEYRLKAVEQAKADYEANPTEVQTIAKYAKTLQDMDNEEYENTAIAMLQKAYEDTRSYRFKMTIGDIRMKQFRRQINALREQIKANPDNKDPVHQLEQLRKDRLAYELNEFQERTEHMPTDMGILFEYGLRLYESGRYDDAIVALQQAQNNPKARVDALHLLGRSFMAQKMIPEAVDTLKKSLDEYDLAPTGDRKSKEIHYWYARALEENKQTAEAIDIYSKIIRWEIGYRDARARLNALRGQA